MDSTVTFSLPEGLSAIVSNATAELPPLTKAIDEVFLRMVFEETVDAFWRIYIDWLPKDARDAFVASFDAPTGEAIIAWHKKYANFAEDAKTRAKAEMIVESLGGKLQASMPKAYADWTPDEAAIAVDDWAIDREAAANHS